jgi:hypothetical protein
MFYRRRERICTYKIHAISRNDIGQPEKHQWFWDLMVSDLSDQNVYSTMNTTLTDDRNVYLSIERIFLSAKSKLGHDRNQTVSGVGCLQGTV